MSAWVYRAVDGRGATRRGQVEAVSAAEARAALRKQDLLPTAVSPLKVAGAGQLPPKTLALVTRQLATLLAGTVRIEEALATVAEEAPARAAGVLRALRGAVLEGRSLGQALGDHPSVFDTYYRASIEAAERAGQVPVVMAHLAVFVETRARNAQKVKLALIYPALLAIVSLGVIAALLTFVVPDIVRVFANRGAELPTMTRVLIAASDALQTYGPGLLAGLAAVGGVSAVALRRPDVRKQWHEALLQVPGVRGLIIKANTSQFAGTLATLTVSHVPLTDALAAAADTVPNLVLRERVQRAAVRVREGQALSAALRETDSFPPMLLAMIASGEASGQLGQSLSRAAEDQARDLDAVVATIVALVEPGVLLVMGGIVMLLVMAILLPIVSLNDLAL